MQRLEEELPGERWTCYRRATGEVTVLEPFSIVAVVARADTYIGDENVENFTHTHK